MLTAVSRCRHAEQADASAVHGAWPRDKEQRTFHSSGTREVDGFAGALAQVDQAPALRGDNEAGVVDDDPRVARAGDR